MNIWNGKGLPPIGTVCELSESILLASDRASEWFEAGTHVEIGGHATFYGAVGPVCAVCVVGSNFTGTLSEVCLRPARTPEQIEAEEREKELNRMVATVSMLDKGWARKVCAGLYDAGYRKFEIVEDDV